MLQSQELERPGSDDGTGYGHDRQAVPPDRRALSHPRLYCPLLPARLHVIKIVKDGSSP